MTAPRAALERQSNVALLPTPAPSPSAVARFDSLSYFDVASLVVLEPGTVENRKYYEGDHWQGGRGWIGPTPLPNNPKRAEILKAIQAAFTSKNKVAEIVDRHVDGVLSRPPSWSLAPREPVPEGDELPAETASAIEDATAVLREWWASRKVNRLLRRYAVSLLLGRRAVLRLHVPSGFVRTAADAAQGDGDQVDPVAAGEESPEIAAGAAGDVSADSIPAGLALIWPEVVPQEYGTVAVDDVTKREIGVFLIVGERGRPEAAELTYLDANGNTIVRRIAMGRGSAARRTGSVTPRRRRRVAADPADRYEFNFGGRLTMYEDARSAAFVTPQLRQLQRALNLAESTIPHSVVTGAFLERTFLNAKSPGYEKLVRDPGTGAIVDRVWVDEAFQTGPLVTAFVEGLDVKNADGSKSYTTPQLQYRDQVSIEPVAGAVDHHYAGMLEESDQLHVLIAGDATASGKSREHARDDFAASLADTVEILESAIIWLLETATAMAEDFAGQVGAWTDVLRVVAKCRIYTGPLSAEERTANRDDMKEGVISRRTAMFRANVDDPDAEEAAIQAQPGARLALSKQQAETLKAWTDASVPVDWAVDQLGLPEEEADELADVIEEEMASLEPVVDPDDPDAEPVDPPEMRPSPDRARPSARRQARRAARATAGAAGARGGGAPPRSGTDRRGRA